MSNNIVDRNWRDLSETLSTLTATGRIDKAIDLLTTALPANSHWTTNQRAAAVGRLVRLHVRNSDIGQAQAVVMDAVVSCKAEGRDVPIWMQVIAHSLDGQTQDAKAVLKDAFAADPMPLSAADIKVIASIALEAHDPETAHFALLEWMARHSGTGKLIKAFLNAAAIYEPQALVDRIKLLIDQKILRPVDLTTLGQQVRHGTLTSGEFADVLRHLGQAWPDTPEIAAQLTLLEQSEVRPDLSNKEPPEQVMSLLEHQRQIGGLDVRTAARLEAFERLSGAPMYRKVIAETNPTEVALSPHVEGGDVIVYFAGISELNFAQELDAFASAAGVNAIYLRDPQRRLFCTGLPSLGGTIESTVAGLREKIATFGPEAKVTTVGASTGAYGAQLYGAWLGADRVLSFSGVTTLSRHVAEQLHDRRARALLHRLEQSSPEEVRVLKTQFLNAGHRPQMDMIFGADNAVDRAHAEYVSEFPEARLYPIAGFERHFSFHYLTALGHMPALLRGDMSVMDPLMG